MTKTKLLSSTYEHDLDTKKLWKNILNAAWLEKGLLKVLK